MFPKRSILFIIIILTLAANLLRAQGIDIILKTIRDHRFDVASKLINNRKKKQNSKGSAQLTSELQAYLEINKDGGWEHRKEPYRYPLSAPHNDTLQCLVLLNRGLYGLLYRHDDSAGFAKLTKALKLAHKIENKPLTCEVLKAIELYYSRLMSLQSDDFFYYHDLHLQNLYDETESNIAFLQFFFLQSK